MLSAPHLILVFLVALLVFGPEKLPELARNFSKWMGEFRRFSGDFQETIQREMRQLERDAFERERSISSAALPAVSSSSDASGAIPPAEVDASHQAEIAGAANGEEDAGNDSAGAFEDHPYEDSFPPYEETADGYEPGWPPESFETDAVESPAGAPATETPAAAHPPGAVKASTEEKSPDATGTEQPVNDHPTAA